MKFSHVLTLRAMLMQITKKKLTSEFHNSPISMTVCDNARSRESCFHATSDLRATAATNASKQIHLPKAIANARFE